MTYSAHYQSPIGNMLLAGEADCLTGLWIAGQKYYAYTLGRDFTLREDLPLFIRTKHWLDDYFAGRAPSPFALPLSPFGNEFRQTVGRIFQDIPYGQLSTYGEVARLAAARLNRSSIAAQAVGSAIAHNPISLIIPCHRVVAANGDLRGFASGLDVKSRLLRFEGSIK